MPQTLQALLDESKLNYSIEQATYSGMSLDNHLDDIIFKKKGDTIYTREKRTGELTETEQKLQEKKWDIIILQEHPGYYYYSEALLEISAAYIEKIKALNPKKKCRYILFRTYISDKKYPLTKQCHPKENFKSDLSNTETFCSEDIASREEDFNYLQKAFGILCRQNHIEASKHLEIIQKYSNQFRDSILDNTNHPTEIGSFLNACIFFKQLTTKNLSKTTFSGKLDPEVAQKIKNFVDETYPLIFI